MLVWKASNLALIKQLIALLPCDCSYPPGEVHLYIDGRFHYFSAQNMRSRDNENVRIISRPPGSDVCNDSAL
ncbi:hypothetical protein KKA87_03285, partial [bacterium]|nr:hypothetical protein [bacterium]MBU1873936.1 hypothetical protein [bacterium]